MATKQEYAVLSQYVYQVRARTENINRPLLPPGWTERELQNDNALGFAYGVFSGPGGEIVVAYTGTNEKKVVDFLVANLPAGAGLFSPQVTQAAQVAARVLQQYGPSNVSFSGHSLGGGLATVMSVWFDRPAVVFDHAPFELSARNPALVLATKTSLALTGYELGAFSSYNEILNFATRELNVSGNHISGEALQFLRLGLPTIGTSQPLSVGSGLGSVDLHSMALYTAATLSPTFAQATIAATNSLSLVMDSRLYASDTATATERNFLLDLIRSEQQSPSASKLDNFAADLNKLGTDIAGLNQAAKDAIIAQGIEWYYHHKTYTGQQFITVTHSVLQYTVANAAGFGVTANKASEWAVKWTTPLLNAEGQFGGAFAVNYDQWNVSGSAGGSASARDATKSQIFIGNSGADTFTGGDQADVILAASGDDTLNGGAGAALLYGGVGNDTLNGGTGSDFLYGSAGNDTYTFTGNWGSDIIVDDSAGQGSIVVDGVTLQGGKKIAGQDNVWQNADQGYTFTLAGTAAGPLLVISKNGSMNTIRVQGWQSGQLGLVMNDTSAAAPLVNQTYNGDQRAKLIGIEIDLNITPDKPTFNTYKWSATSRAADGTLIGGLAEANHYKFRSSLRPCLLLKTPTQYPKKALKNSFGGCAPCRWRTRSGSQTTLNSTAACARKKGVIEFVVLGSAI